MKKIIALLALLPTLAFGATTWATTDQGVKATCTTGTEAAPTLVTQGIALDAPPRSGARGVNGFALHVETGGTMTAGGLLKAYLWNPAGNAGAGQWNPAPDLDVTVSALAAQSFQGFQVVSPGPGSRIAFVPSGVGVAATIYINVTYGP